jgi:hypothetical protein
MRDITSDIQAVRCCIVEKNYQIAHGKLSGIHKECEEAKTVLMHYKLRIIAAFKPIGTITITAVNADADLDFTGTTLGTQSGVVTIDLPNGTSITVGFFSGTYATISDLIDDIIAGLINGWTGVNNDPILTLTCPVNLGINPIGGTVTITFQPEFGKDAGTDVGGGSTPKGSCTVNEPTSACYGFTFTSNTNTNTVGVWNYDNFVTNIVLPVGSQPNDCCYDPVKNFIYVPCTNQNNVEVISCATNPPTLTTPLALGHISASCAYSTFDGCKYITVQASNQLAQVNAANVITLSLGQYNALTPMEIDQYSGNIWIGSGGINRLYIVDPTNINNILVQSDLATTINGAITFYPHSDSTKRRMFISDYFGQKIQEWGLDGTLINPAFITLSSNPNTVFYSSFFDKLFVSNGSVINVYNMDGTPYTVPITVGSPPAQTINNFGDDIAHEATFGITVAATTDNLQFFTLFEAQDEVEGEFEGEVTTHTRTAEENCNTEEEILTALEGLKEECKSCGCGGSINDIQNNNPPVITGQIYYGRSDLTALTEAQILALGTANQTTFQGTFSYVASPGTYIYFACPTSFGIPSRFDNLSSPFDVIMDSSYPITMSISGVSYRIWRSANQLGGAITMSPLP